MQFTEHLVDNLMVAINNFSFVILADAYPNFLKLITKIINDAYMRLFQLLTRFTAVFDVRSYRLYSGTVIFISLPTVRPLYSYWGLNCYYRPS